MSQGTYRVDSFFHREGIYFKNSNYACFAGLNCSYIYANKDVKIDKEVREFLTLTGQNDIIKYKGVRYATIKDLFKSIYVIIDKSKGLTTDCRLSKLVLLINQITPCKIVNVKVDKSNVAEADMFKDLMNKDLKCIQFDLLHSYDSSLILLNFIRNYWYSPITNYSSEFFRLLNSKELGKEKDPLKRLTMANKKACELINCVNYYGHSNMNNHNNLTIKSTQQLLDYKGYSTSAFLTT